MKSFIRLFVIGVAAFFIFIALFTFSATTAVAQEKAESAAQVEKEITPKKEFREEYGIGTMTVTAQKREENVQDVPISMDVFTAWNLRTRALIMFLK